MQGGEGSTMFIVLFVLFFLCALFAAAATVLLVQDMKNNPRTHLILFYIFANITLICKLTHLLIRCVSESFVLRRCLGSILESCVPVPIKHASVYQFTLWLCIYAVCDGYNVYFEDHSHRQLCTRYYHHQETSQIPKRLGLHIDGSYNAGVLCSADNHWQWGVEGGKPDEQANNCGHVWHSRNRLWLLLNLLLDWNETRIWRQIHAS